LVANSGNFVSTIPLLWRDGSLFDGFMHFSDWLYAQTRQTHNIALSRLRDLTAQYLTDEAGLAQEDVQRSLDHDRERTCNLSVADARPRQARHLAGSRQPGQRPMPAGTTNRGCES